MVITFGERLSCEGFPRGAPYCLELLAQYHFSTNVLYSSSCWKPTPDISTCNEQHTTPPRRLTLILPRSRTGTVRFYTSTSNKRAARPKLYTKSLTRDLKLMYSRFTLVRISIKLQAPCVLYIGTGVSLLSRERFLYI